MKRGDTPGSEAFVKCKPHGAIACLECAKQTHATGHRQVAYLAGPMRGYAEYNFPAFHAAAAKLRAHGLDVWSPAEHDVNEDGFDPAKDTAQPMKHYMRRDLPAVLTADMVCVLPGWEKSQGACLEVHVAQTCGIPVYVAETMQPVASAPSERGLLELLASAGNEIRNLSAKIDAGEPHGKEGVERRIVLLDQIDKAVKP